MGMVLRERISVPKAGITQAVLEKIHDTWRKTELDGGNVGSMDNTRGILKFLGPLEIASSKRQTKIHNIGARLVGVDSLLMLKPRRYGIEHKENFSGGR
ncbi:hypothetical protein DVH24_034025 [Malus domestica]|uniref:Uncharacterized protein n=1 Tax=Malus domestica TaxID=3750 RepID=A0A498KNQ1_MALDO|nr:hypothetical protein DVH24_034025 [Malus domestica]